jgi:protein SSD1
MDQQQHNPTGPGGRRLHIAHRRSPSELTPLMSMSHSLYKDLSMPQHSFSKSSIYKEDVFIASSAIQIACLQNTVEQLALQQQIEMLQAQQQQMLQTHQQYANMGLLPPNQTHLPPNFNPLQHQQMTGISPQHQQQGNFQFPPQQQGAAPQGAPTQPSAHRRNASALPGMGGANGPPPAPSSGAAGGNFGEFSMPGAGGNVTPRRPSGGPVGDRGHQRRHSLALPEAKKAAELAQQRRGQPGFQFPPPSGTSASPNTGSNSPASASTPTPTENTPAPSNPPQPPQNNQGTNLGPPQVRPMRGGGAHGRSQSLAVQNGRGSRIAGFQFPQPMPTNDAGINPNANQQQQPAGGQNVERRGSNSGFQGHGRTSSRNYQDNWRNQNQNQQSNAPIDVQNQNQGQYNPGFQPGHRPRASMGASLGSFQFPAQPNLMIPGAAGQGIFINPATGQPQILNPNLLQQQQLTQLQMQQAALGVQQLGLGNMGQPGQNLSNQQQQQQQRKTLFTPYLPQASLPALLSNGQLVSGILRVNKKNRSDAYVSTQDGLLDADIFICGSKDRNRALEGDLVAIELLDVDEVWGQKREKEEKKKRKDITESSRGANVSSNSPNDATTGGDGNDQTTQPGGMRRRGSLRQRPTQKKNDDVEVEGQSLLLVEEEEISDEQKPLYAGHVVAVIERVAGQMFSG